MNIACGVHAGSPDVMRHTVRLARQAGVAVGAHPGFPDPAGVGRRPLPLAPEQIEALIAYQVGALLGVARLEGVRVDHVKPHGALYNQAAKDRTVADAIVRAIRALDPGLILVGLASSALIDAGKEARMWVAEEAFVDRAYAANGTLVPRDKAGALLSDENDILERARALALHQPIRAFNGSVLSIRADTLCLHGDTPGAERLAERLHGALTQFGVEIRPLGERLAAIPDDRK